MADSDPVAAVAPDVDVPFAAVAPAEQGPVCARARRSRVAALDDRGLVTAMRADDPLAWAEFDARFRPVLIAYARRVRPSEGLTDADVADALVDDLLTEEASRLVAPHATVVSTLVPYLLRAAKHRLYNLRRAAARRRRRYESVSCVGESASGPHAGHHGEDARVVAPLCSEFALRLSTGDVSMPHEGSSSSTSTSSSRASRSSSTPDIESDEDVQGESAALSDDARADDRERSETTPVLQLAAALRAATTTDEQLLLTWVAERVPHRTIAAWLGVTYDAAAKRVWRLCRRLRAAAVRHVEALAADERREVERFLRRAGALPPLVAVALHDRVFAAAPVRAVNAGEFPQRPTKAGECP